MSAWNVVWIIPLAAVSTLVAMALCWRLIAWLSRSHSKGFEKAVTLLFPVAGRRDGEAKR